MPPVSVVIPAYNEQSAIRAVVLTVRQCLSDAGVDCEIVVVVDGATDGTAREAAEVADQVVEHPVNLGYGRSLKSGILHARHDRIAILDADGTYPVEKLPDLLRAADRFDMIVGARSGRHYSGGTAKRAARWVFRRLAEFSAGQMIPDINSGFRVFRREQMMHFFPIISSGFSFTTTSTLAYLHNDLLVHYVPIPYHQRSGRSHVRYFRDSLRALQIIVEAILRFNPIKIFLLLAFPYAAAGLLLVLWGMLLGGAWLILVGGIGLLCTAGVVLAIGFHAVPVIAARRKTEPVLHIVRSRAEGEGRDAEPR